MFEGLNLGIFLIELLIQTLDCRQRHTVGIHGGDMAFVRAQPKGGVAASPMKFQRLMGIAATLASTSRGLTGVKCSLRLRSSAD